MAMRYTGNRFDAEDLLQETVFMGLKNFHQLRDEAKCKHWLFAILRNLYLSQVERCERIVQTDFDEKGPDYVSLLEEAAQRPNPEQDLMERMDAAQIQSILDRLPEKYKSPILLYFMEGMSYQEIAVAMNLPIGTVMSRLSRGKELLKKSVLRASLAAHRESRVVDFRRSHGKE
jgi:RNA polymerase sigma-70 factor (ECF subfamily)